MEMPLVDGIDKAPTALGMTQTKWMGQVLARAAWRSHVALVRQLT